MEMGIVPGSVIDAGMKVRGRGWDGYLAVLFSITLSDASSRIAFHVLCSLPAPLLPCQAMALEGQHSSILTDYVLHVSNKLPTMVVFAAALSPPRCSLRAFPCVPFVL